MKRLAVWSSSVGAAILVLAVGILVWMTLGTDVNSAERNVVFPAIWTASVPDEGEMWQGASIRLDEGGSATLTNVPEGSVRRRDGARCLDQTGDVYSGEARWQTGASASEIIIKHPRGDFILVANQGKFGSVDWLDVSTPFCNGAGPAAFGLRTDLKR